MQSRDQDKEVNDKELKKVEFLLGYDEVLKPYFEKGLIKLVNKPEDDFLWFKPGISAEDRKVIDNRLDKLCDFVPEDREEEDDEGKKERWAERREMIRQLKSDPVLKSYFESGIIDFDNNPDKGTFSMAADISNEDAKKILKRSIEVIERSKSDEILWEERKATIEGEMKKDPVMKKFLEKGTVAVINDEGTPRLKMKDGITTAEALILNSKIRELLKIKPEGLIVDDPEEEGGAEISEDGTKKKYILIKDKDGKNLSVSKIIVDWPGTGKPLTPKQVERVKAYREILGDHDAGPLEKVIDQIGQDASPEVEIACWERIAKYFAKEKELRPYASWEEMHSIYSALIGCSMIATLEELKESLPAAKELPDLERVWKVWHNTE